MDGDVLKTKPWKKKLIHPMRTICGTIITACVFIPAIIPSMAAGSERGFGGGEGVSLVFPSVLLDFSLSLRYSPEEKDVRSELVSVL